ncbi:Uncharacterised protein [Enterococcus casseliflavus]|nr:Uncharacterised protein [Enterococcus casseliflavus]
MTSQEDELIEVEEELEQLRQREDELLKELEEKSKQVQAFEEKAIHLEEKAAIIENYKLKEVESMRRITSLENENQQLNLRLQEAEAKYRDLERSRVEQLADKNVLQRDLERELAKVEQMKDELATILIEAKEKARETAAEAELEADRRRQMAENEAHKIISEASMEVMKIRQEIKQYQERLTTFHHESKGLFEQLIQHSKVLNLPD